MEIKKYKEFDSDEIINRLFKQCCSNVDIDEERLHDEHSGSNSVSIRTVTEVIV